MKLQFAKYVKRRRICLKAYFNAKIKQGDLYFLQVAKIRLLNKHDILLVY